MSSVDNRIVQMQFDNKQFEDGIRTSTRSLDNFKQTLDRDGDGRGLDGLARAIDTISSKFSAMSVIGITALANVTNSAINAGRNLVSSLTIDPIRTGLQEYETKMNAITTILTNTQGSAQSVGQSSVAAVTQTAKGTAGAVGKSSDAALRALRKNQQQTMDAFRKAADDELQTLQDKQDKETEILKSGIDDEINAIKNAHTQKLDLYNQEYMAKLKVIDEDRYTKIKAIDDEIKALKGATKAEEKKNAQDAEQAKILELEDKLRRANTLEERIPLENALNDLKAKAQKEQEQADREARIEALNQTKDNINQEYDDKVQALKDEYDAKKKEENDLYDIKINTIRKQEDEALKSLDKTHRKERDLLKDQQDAKLSAIKDAQDAEIEALNKTQKVAIGNIGLRRNVSTKGSTLDDVNAALAELNDYADKTIYNFAEMTDNVGRFTAAGVGLKDAVTAVKGMSNVAAGFGVDATRMAGATYQMSQALASGVVRLEDWMSMERTGMGGPMLQNALKETARNMGIAIDETVSFRDSLKDGWLTADVFITTMDKMAKDPALLEAATNITTFTKLLDVMRESVQSGWAMSWEYILGDKNESTKLFTSIGNGFANIAGSSAEARNETLKFWNDNGGRDAIIESITNSFKALQAILGPVGKAFREVFPRMTGERLVAISKSIRDLTEQFKIGEETSNNIKLSFKGLFAVIDIGVKTFQLLGNAIWMFIKALLPISGSFLSLTSSISEYLVKLDESIKSSNTLGVTVEKMGVAFGVLGDFIKKGLGAIGPVLDGLRPILAKLGEAFSSLFGGTKVLASGLDSTEKSFTTTTSLSDKLWYALTKVWEVLVSIGTGISKVARGIGNVLGPILDSLKKKFDSLSMQDIGALLTGSGLLVFANALSKGITSVDKVVGNFAKILGEVADTLKAFQLKVKAEALLKVAIALGILAAALVALSFINIEDLAKSLGALTIMLTAVIGALMLLNKKGKGLEKLGGLFGQIGTSLQLIGLATGILILAGAMKILASIDTQGLIKGTGAIGALMTMIVAFMMTTNSLKLGSSASGLTGFAIGITILAGAVAILGNMKYENLLQGSVALATIMTVIAAFIKLTSGGDLATSAGGLIGFSIGITILSGALTILGKMKYDTLLQGTIAITSLMTVIMMFINLTKGGDLATSAAGLIGFSIGITILAGALSILGKLKLATLIQGTLAIAQLMVMIGNFIMLTREGDLAASAAGLIGFAFGIMVMSKALAILGNLKVTSVIQGTAALSALITCIALFVDLTQGGDLAASAAGLVGFAFGLTILTAAVYTLSLIDPKRIKQGVVAVVALMASIAAFIMVTREGDLAASAVGLLAFSKGVLFLAGAIAILSALNPQKLMVASVALSTLVVSIGMFANMTKWGNLAKSSVGLIVFSVGIAALSLSLLQLAKLDYRQIIAGSAAITILLAAIVGFVNLTNPAQLALTSIGIVVFSGALLVLTQAITTLGTADIKTLLIGIGALAGLLIVLGLTSAVLAPLIPVMIGLSAALLLFGAACLAIGGGMLAFAMGMDIMSKSGIAGADALKVAVEAMISLIPLALVTLAKGLIDFAKTLGDGAPVVAASFMKVINAILDTSVQVLPKLVNAGLTLVLAILNGIRNNIQQIVEAGIDIVIKFVQGVTSKLPAIIDTAFKLIISFINGLADAIDGNHNALYQACLKLINAIINAITDLIPNLVTVGEYMIKGLIKGLTNMDKALDSVVTGLIKKLINSVEKLLGINSPSKVFAGIGRYSMMGFANGISNYSGLVSDEAAGVGQTAMDTLRNAVSNIADIISGDLDMNPTIRPVLDLTDVSNGVGMIGSMLNRNSGITVSNANLRTAAISNSMRPAIPDSQNGSINPVPIVDGIKTPQPMTLQLMLQNGKAIAEFIIDDVNTLMGGTTKVAGRSAGI